MNGTNLKKILVFASQNQFMVHSRSMEHPSNQRERLDRLFASRKQRVIAHTEVSVGSRCKNCWQFICTGNVSKAMTEFSLAIGTTYSTIVNPNAGARRKR